jgi:hypothetical protein
MMALTDRLMAFRARRMVSAFLTFIAVIALFTVSTAQQNPPAAGAASLSGGFMPVTLTSNVAQLNFNYFYQPESLRLSSGEVVSFPVDMGCSLVAGDVKVGDSLTISGEQFLSASGAKSVRAEIVTNNTSHKKLRTENAERDIVSPSGKIAQLNYGQDGDVNGLILSSGELVLWKARPALSVTVMPGDNVKVTGISQVSPNGRIVIGAQTVNGVSVAAPPPMRRNPVDAPVVAIITNTGSTNTAAYRVRITRSGQATLTIGELNTTAQVPLPLARRFFNDLTAAMPLGKLPVDSRCPKSASFGSSTFVGYGSQQSPDLTCSADSRGRSLGDDVNAIIQGLNLGNMLRK